MLKVSLAVSLAKEIISQMRMTVDLYPYFRGRNKVHCVRMFANGAGSLKLDVKSLGELSRPTLTRVVQVKKFEELEGASNDLKVDWQMHVKSLGELSRPTLTSAVQSQKFEELERLEHIKVD